MGVFVVCLEGCHGSGKTGLTSAFSELGLPVLDEGFMSMPSTILHPQSLLMETTWVCAWFQRLLDHVRDVPKGTDKLIIADRSPLSAVYYARHQGTALEPLIRTYVKEVAEAADLHICTVHLRTDRDLLWSRIQARLAREPNRTAFREDSIEWMDRTLHFYDNMRWDLTIPNNTLPFPTLAANILRNVAKMYPLVAGILSGNAMTTHVLADTDDSMTDDNKENVAPMVSKKLEFLQSPVAQRTNHVHGGSPTVAMDA